jgi:hypothetical protein
MRLTDARPFHIAIAAIIGVLLSGLLLLCAGRIDQALTTYQRSPWASLALFDIAGIIYRIPDQQVQAAYYASIPPRLRGTGTLDRLLGTYYSKYWEFMLNDPQPAFVCPTGEQSPVMHRLSMFEACFKLTEEESRSLMQVWKTAVIHHPVAWLSHRLSVFRHVIGFNHDDLWSPVFMKSKTDFSKEVLAQAYGQQLPQLTELQGRAKWHFERLAERWFYRPWIYLTLSVCIIVLCVWSRTSDRLQIALIAASGLAHEAGLFLLAPSADYRYSHYMIYAAMLALMLSSVREGSPLVKLRNNSA